MRVLVLNGSPRGTQSNTLQLTEAFIRGIQSMAECEVERISVCQKEIRDCLGCFGCWTKTPGKCVIQDDMEQILNSYLAADIVIWSFPLYYYGMPSRIKALMDRLLPLNLPFMEVSEGGSGCSHPSRYDMSGKKYVLVSTCGFFKRENNYDSLEKQFDILYGKDLLKILCPEGELFAQPQLRALCGKYLGFVERAGREWMGTGQVSEAVKNKLEELLYPPEVFVELADASWGIAKKDTNHGGPAKRASNGAADLADGQSSEAKPALSKAARLMRQMAAIYNPAACGRDLILEFCFTDLDETYQLSVRNGKCSMKTREDGFEPYTTRIETPYDLWMDISAGKVNGAQAMMEQKYRTLGDFDVMLSLDKMFGISSEPEPEQREKPKRANMSVMILVWCAVWIFLPVDPALGACAGILAAACVPLAGMKWRLTVYDAVTALCVSVIGLSASGVIRGFTPDSSVLICLSYLIFGLLWTLSCLRPLPLSAHYSCNDYGGDAALKNPLFIKTNRILSLCWGILYLLTPVWTWFLMQGSLSSFTGAFNSLCPAAMGIFTLWFQKWYPAKVARG